MELCTKVSSLNQWSVLSFVRMSDRQVIQNEQSSPRKGNDACATEGNSTGFEQKNSHLATVKVYKVFGLVCHIASEIATHHAMPCWTVSLIELQSRKIAQIIR